MNVKLLNCPFCGGKADYDVEPMPRPDIFSIWCSVCKVGVDSTCADGDLVAIWNRRTTGDEND
jgi:hypothetical protein